MDKERLIPDLQDGRRPGHAGVIDARCLVIRTQLRAAGKKERS